MRRPSRRRSSASSENGTRSSTTSTNLGHTLAKQCADHLERLAPFAERYGASSADDRVHESPGLLETLRHKSAELLGRSERSGLLLLRDLRNLYVTAQEAELAWLILAQAAQAVRDRDLLQTVTLCHEEAEARGEWLRTRIKESPRFSPPASARRSSLQPGGERFLDIGAAAWSFESRLNPFRLDDDDRWRLLNAEARGEFVVCFVVDSAKGEGLVVPSALQDLSEEAFDPARPAGRGRVEEHQRGPGLHVHDLLMCSLRRVSG